MLKQNKGRINGIIILLVIILIFGTIFALQITGVIKPSKKRTDNNTTTNTQAEISKSSTYKSIETIIKEEERNAIIRTIITLIITIGLNIGICKLYSKLSLPPYIVTFNFIWPILTIFNSMLPTAIQFIISLIAGILGIMTLWYYFKAVGMSGWWAILPFGSAFLIFIPFLALGGFLAFIVAYILSNIKLSKIFNKGTGFTVRTSNITFYIPTNTRISKRLRKDKRRENLKFSSYFYLYLFKFYTKNN